MPTRKIKQTKQIFLAEFSNLRIVVIKQRWLQEIFFLLLGRKKVKSGGGKLY
jgi:hypothetical protein